MMHGEGKHTLADGSWERKRYVNESLSILMR
jgi:hypothetical protein